MVQLVHMFFYIGPVKFQFNYSPLNVIYSIIDATIICAFLCLSVQPQKLTVTVNLHVPFVFTFEPHRDKNNKMACAPSEGSDQAGHPPSLIRVFAVCMKKARVLSYPVSAQRRL